MCYFFCTEVCLVVVLLHGVVAVDYYSVAASVTNRQYLHTNTENTYAHFKVYVVDRASRNAFFQVSIIHRQISIWSLHRVPSFSCPFIFDWCSLHENKAALLLCNYLQFSVACPSVCFGSLQMTSANDGWEITRFSCSKPIEGE